MFLSFIFVIDPSFAFYFESFYFVVLIFPYFGQFSHIWLIVGMCVLVLGYRIYIRFFRSGSLILLSQHHRLIIDNFDYLLGKHSSGAFQRRLSLIFILIATPCPIGSTTALCHQEPLLPLLFCHRNAHQIYKQASDEQNKKRNAA